VERDFAILSMLAMLKIEGFRQKMGDFLEIKDIGEETLKMTRKVAGPGEHFGVQNSYQGL
jgi:hypothetical protein